MMFKNEDTREAAAYSESLINALIEQLQQYDGFIALYLYGSRAKGDHGIDSDHDFFAVFADSVDDIMDYLHKDNGILRSKIKKRLRQSNLPTHFDLLMAKKTKFEESAKEINSHAWQCLVYGIKLYEDLR